jgi:hypothetical protein
MKPMPASIAVLGDRGAAGGDDERGEGRDIVRAGIVAAGADDVDRVPRRLHTQHLGAHRFDGAGDLFDAFATCAQRHQEAAHLRRRHFARQHRVESRRRLGAIESRASCDFGYEGLEGFHSRPGR